MSQLAGGRNAWMLGGIGFLSALVMAAIWKVSRSTQNYAELPVGARLNSESEE